MEGVFTGGSAARTATGGGASFDRGIGGVLDDIGNGTSSKAPKERYDDLSDAYSRQGIDMGNSLPADMREEALSKRSRQGSFGDVLNSQFSGSAAPKEPTLNQEAAAGLMLRAMIQAAKSDGRFDDDERSRIMDRLEDASPAERQFVHRELSAQVDPAGLAAETPPGLESQVYAMSLLGIDLDTRDEAQHLHQLAEALGLSRQGVNGIHDQMGVPRLYA